MTATAAQRRALARDRSSIGTLQTVRLSGVRRGHPRWGSGWPARALVVVVALIVVDDLAEAMLRRHEFSHSAWSGPAGIGRRLAWRAIAQDDARGAPTR